MLLAVGFSAPADAGTRLPGARPDISSPEAGLWGLFDRAEIRARQSGELNQDAALNAYVRGVACKVAAEYCRDLRVYVLDRPFMNATMAPNGYAEVWSGLLLRCESEAELAFVLGHEATHYAEFHSLNRHEANKSRANATLALSVGIAVVGAAAATQAPTYDSARAIMDATGNLIDVVYLAGVAALFGFNREQESEADLLGLRRAVAAGYAPGAAAESWRHVVNETAASDFEKKRRADARLGIFDTHPLTSQRVLALETQAKQMPQGGDSGRERYRAAIRPFLGRWLKDDLRRRDFGQTLSIIDRLARSQDDLGILNFYRGEVFRLRGAVGDAALAADAYQASAKYADAPVAVWRELGEVRRRQNDVAGARAAYQAYLEHASEAEDAWMVRDTLDALPATGGV